MQKTSALLIAAGLSERMGSPKSLLPWQDETLIEYQLSVLKKIGIFETIVVLGYSAEEIIRKVNPDYEAKIVINTDYLQGKTTSIRAGVRAVSNESNNLILIAVDQPRPAGLLSCLIHAQESTEFLITQPFYKGKGGHPLVFDTVLLSELEGITEDNLGVREIMERHALKVNRMPVRTGIVLLDINTRKEYSMAKTLFRDR